MHNDLNDSGMQLIFIPHRSRTSFQIRNIRIIIRYNQRTLKLSRVTGIDTEISGKLHRATYSFRNIHERAVREHCGIQRCKEIVPITYYRAHIFLHQIRMLPHGFTERAEYNSFLHQCFLKGSLYGNRVHNGIHCHSTKSHLLFQRNSQFIKRLYQFRIDFLHALRSFFLLCRIGIIRNRLIINFRDTEMCPGRHFQRQPMAIRFQSKLQQPLRFVLFR